MYYPNPLETMFVISPKLNFVFYLPLYDTAASKRWIRRCWRIRNRIRLGYKSGSQVSVIDGKKVKNLVLLSL